jgi:hypothetical protein
LRRFAIFEDHPSFTSQPKDGQATKGNDGDPEEIQVSRPIEDHQDWRQQVMEQQ